MTDNDKPAHRRKITAKEHLAGVHAARKYIQALSAEGLLRSQHPVRDEPIPTPGEAPK
jgi:hypothetical protein